ncbi:MAG: NAD-binding protein [Erysipelotrichaceae bacterium]|nr:NAD-binding protein [Erysipelotrichaceae bacterium]
MKVIIVGCGMLGSGLANSLAKKGNQVTVIDKDEDALLHLSSDFSGDKVIGIGFDKEILEKAKISYVDAIVACTTSDEVNALIARIAKDIYKVPRVISRLYDPRKAEIYRTFGIQTISTTSWGVARALELLSYSQLDTVLSIGDSSVEMVRIEVPSLLIGKTVNDVLAIGEFQVTAISRDNKSFLPTLGTVLQKQDIIYISVMTSSIKRLKSLLGLD